MLDDNTINALEIIGNLGEKYNLLNKLKEKGFNINVRKDKPNKQWCIDIYLSKGSDILGVTSEFKKETLFGMSNKTFEKRIMSMMHDLTDLTLFES